MRYMNMKKAKSAFTPPFLYRAKQVAERAGFTLIEMLIVTMIISVISLAIFSTFDNGIKIWQRVNNPMPGEDVAIFLNKFGRDLRNAFKFEGIRFAGEKDKLEFASLVTNQTLQITTVGKVVYFYNASKETLDRVEKDFSQIYGDEKGKETQVLEKITDLNFRYYYYDTEKKEFNWEETWHKGDFPLAVRLELKINNDRDTETYVKTVNLPTSTLL